MKRSSPLSRTTALRARTGLRRTGGPRRVQPMKAVNPARRERAFARAYGSEARCAWVTSLACVVPGCTAPCEVMHVRARAAGGTADDTVPCCHAHHMENHALGLRTFEQRHLVDLANVAACVALRWRAFASPTL